MTFTKLFSSITASTVWCEPSDTRVVWITMLAMADRHGRVWASIPGLAKEAAVSLESCQTAIDKFLAPDPYSRTKVAEGRRIEPIDGGWRLINHAKYRAIRDEEERRAYKAEKQREYRSVDNVDKCGPPLTTVEPGSHNAEADTDTEAKKKTSPKPRKRDSGMKHSTDPRHIACKNEIFAYYRFHNEGDDPDWEGREGAALGKFLGANPKLTAEGMKKLLSHRGRSEVNHSERPSKWIQNLKSFRMGPLNQFNKPKGVQSNGTGSHNLAVLAESFREDQDGADSMFDIPGSQDGPLDLKALLQAAAEGTD